MARILTRRMELAAAKKLGIDSWSRWECEPSSFDWHYPDTETAYVFEGDVIVSTDEGETHITGGMLVTFPAGLSCRWEVRKRISKVYTFKCES